MFIRDSEEDLSRFGLAEKSRAILFENLSLTEYDAAITEEITNFRFTFGTLMWLDIMSSVTTGAAPNLQHELSYVMASKSGSRLEDIMGCKHTVMLQIGRLAAMYAQKTLALQQGAFDCSSLENIVSDISLEIQNGFANEVLQELKIAEPCSASALNAVLNSRRLVTRMFLYAASIYLRLLVQGFHNLDEFNTTVQETMTMLRIQVPTHLLPSIVCPLFFIGCVAREEDKQFFRAAFTSSPLLNPLLKHRGRILPILEEIWSKRTKILGFGWQDCVKLTKDILLI